MPTIASNVPLRPHASHAGRAHVRGGVTRVHTIAFARSPRITAVLSLAVRGVAD